MSEPADGDGPAGDPPDEPATPAPAAQPPATTGAQPAAASPPRAELPRAELPRASIAAFPDDGPLSGWLRSTDRALGTAEQAVLFCLLGAVVLTAAAAALSDRLLGIRLGRWWFDIVRGGTFSIAMIGAVFASHQQRHLAMDLVSRRLPPRGRLVLRVILGLFTAFVATLLLLSGLAQVGSVGGEGGDHLISTQTIVMFMPIGAALIIVHTILHMAIDIDYLARGKLPPAQARSAH